jgi:UDP-glucuronate 4-epimerase
MHERDFVAKAIAAATIAAVPAVVLNFAGSQAASVEEYTALAAALAGRPVRYSKVPAGYSPSPADVSRMEAALGPTVVGVRDGVVDVVAALSKRT